MSTKSTSSNRVRGELRKEYELDYAKSKPNRFAAKLAGTTMVVLQPDVAEVFQSAKAVNDLLRSAIAATGARGSTQRSKPQSREPLINPTSRHPGESRDPVTFVQRTELQRHWVPDIASRFRDDDQNQSFLSARAGR